MPGKNDEGRGRIRWRDNIGGKVRKIDAIAHYLSRQPGFAGKQRCFGITDEQRHVGTFCGGNLPRPQTLRFLPPRKTHRVKFGRIHIDKIHNETTRKAVGHVSSHLAGESINRLNRWQNRSNRCHQRSIRKGKHRR